MTPFEAESEEEGTLAATPGIAVGAAGDIGAAVSPTGAARGATEIPLSLHERFEDFQLIGRGGMGAVYRARDYRLRRTVAVKLLFVGDASSQGGFLQEARSQARILHPRVCEVFDAGIADHVHFIVMRYVDGASLNKVREAMTIEEKVGVIREIAFALHEAHRLGVVHRDVKPGNILVERGEDGAWKPYIADFGIARDLTEGGPTRSNALQGTPAFMAPEQAAGRAASLDRRTDVYGLGATLHAVLAGSPPFAASRTLALLKMVLETPAPPLRTIDPSMPADLEAIVLKCLEKDQAARYESAKALGEDLQRFLDGDPVAARPRSPGVRLWKQARKNKGKVAAGSLAFLVAIVLAGLWIRSLRLAGEREALAREMGGSVREMELFLRGAHALPLHDIERERDVLRLRLREIEARTSAAGDIGVGAGNDALGRGHLALQDAATAMDHFRKAEAAGYRAPGFDYSMGLALTELYRRELEKTTRIQKESEKQARIVEIERQYRAPALAHLRAALAQGVESPAYAIGLVAMHEGHHEEALLRAREAFAAAPWLHEAKKLEGDVLFAMGSRTRHDKKAFDYQSTIHYFEQAAEAYGVAADLARSDPAIHEAECELWTQAMNAAAEHGDSMRPMFERARGACERAIRVSPRSSSGRLKLAFAHLSFAFWVVNGMHDGESPEQALSQATECVEAAAGVSPDDAFASYLVGAVWRARASYTVKLGRDAAAAIDRAVAGYEAALALDPAFLWALNEQCAALSLRGKVEAQRGLDPAPTFALALARCDRAIALDPDFMFPKATSVNVYIRDAERLVAAGLSPQPAVEKGLALVAAAEAQDPTWQWIPFWRAALLRTQAEYAIAKGEDPAAVLARAEASAGQFAAGRASHPDADADAAVGEIAAVSAEVRLARLERGEGPRRPDPELEADLSRARVRFASACAETPWELDYALWLARVELTELRYRLALGSATAAQADAAMAPLQPFLGEPRADPRLPALVARVQEARAALGGPRRQGRAAQ